MQKANNKPNTQRTQTTQRTQNTQTQTRTSFNAAAQQVGAQSANGRTANNFDTAKTAATAQTNTQQAVADANNKMNDMDSRLNKGETIKQTEIDSLRSDLKGLDQNDSSVQAALKRLDGIENRNIDALANAEEKNAEEKKGCEGGGGSGECGGGSGAPKADGAQAAQAAQAAGDKEEEELAAMLAKLLGISPAEAKKLIAEMKKKGINPKAILEGLKSGQITPQSLRDMLKGAGIELPKGNSAGMNDLLSGTNFSNSSSNTSTSYQGARTGGTQIAA